MYTNFIIEQDLSEDRARMVPLPTRSIHRRNAPKRMDGDPNARIATEQARQSAAQRDGYSGNDTPSSSRANTAGGGDASSSTPDGDNPLWDFEPVWEPAVADAYSGEQQHPNR